MMRIYVLWQTILGDGTFYVGIYDNKKTMFKDMKELMELTGTNFEDVEEVKETLEQEWSYTTKEVESIKEELFVSINNKDSRNIEVSTVGGKNTDNKITFLSKVNQRSEDGILIC